MIYNEINIRVIEPEEGFILTNGETYSDKVYLGINDSPDNWVEMPLEIYNENIEIENDGSNILQLEPNDIEEDESIRTMSIEEDVEENKPGIMQRFLNLFT